METHNQDQDVDMDAPQISTLRQEDSPPPPPRRVKLLVKDTRVAVGQASSSRKRPLSDDEPEEEDEEDQLIDDDDVVPPPVVPPVAAPSAAVDSASKRKAPSKRKPRKSAKKLAEEERETIMQAGGGPPSLAPTMSWFEVEATKAHQQAGQMGTLDVGPIPPNVVSLDPGAAAGPSKPPPKKKAARKPPAVPRVRVKPGPKPKVLTAAAVLLPPPEDTDVISEGYSVTAASSPVTAHFEGNTPEPEPFPPYTNGPLNEEPLIPINLQDVALPQYPLPVKPFPVQPPQKINTGFAPIVPIDRTGAKVRHWRPVNREIRGIAGGRWFTRTWMGEKESPLAIAIASGAGDKQSSSVALPKLPSMSISAPLPAKNKARATKNSSVTNSAAPSRSSSAVPSKMRTIMLAVTAPPSEGGDSDMVAAPGS
ncbi:hypothetical protein DFH08DRAFT_371236 [Mycena albidolilacea]|uniref:Uncharacterized protein n=1 Tax=Mycena albidolilacea TaxID=1033008 RepID=A0AAD7AKA5_9AGAR|nr:hypothetical protein DFH08DRAFT_371236 [Mycena albidolilacea]